MTVIVAVLVLSSKVDAEAVTQLFDEEVVGVELEVAVSDLEVLVPSSVLVADLEVALAVEMVQTRVELEVVVVLLDLSSLPCFLSFRSVSRARSPTYSHVTV